MTDQIAPQDAPAAVPPPPPVRRVGRRGPVAIAPALSVVGLLIAGLLTFQVYRNWTPTLSSSAVDTPTATPVPVESGQTPTPAPTATIKTNPEISVPGTLVYVENGSLWVQSGTKASQLTQPVNGSKASQPAFSPDGQWIYYIDTRVTTGRWIDTDPVASFTYPVLCRIRPDGTGKKDVLSGLIKSGSLRTFFWLLEPSISSGGTTAAVMSDGPGWSLDQDLLIHYVNLNNGKLGPALPLPDTAYMGLSDPAFSPNGQSLAYTMEGASHQYGAPSIWILRSGVPRKLASGYRAPSWSPDGNYVAATKVAGASLDVVVLDAASGKMVARVTSDGMSWAPVWSPDGNELVFMQMTGSIVDLNMVYISGSGSDLTFKIEPHLTDYSGLDGSSPASWYIPGYGPAPAPTASPSPGASDTAAPTTPAPTASTAGPTATPT
jgi:hypothetical protein